MFEIKNDCTDRTEKNCFLNSTKPLVTHQPELYLLQTALLL